MTVNYSWRFDRYDRGKLEERDQKEKKKKEEAYDKGNTKASKKIINHINYSIGQQKRGKLEGRDQKKTKKKHKSPMGRKR
jgi:hypothetical protein